MKNQFAPQNLQFVSFSQKMRYLFLRISNSKLFVQIRCGNELEESRKWCRKQKESPERLVFKHKKSLEFFRLTSFSWVFVFFCCFFLFCFKTCINDEKEEYSSSCFKFTLSLPTYLRDWCFWRTLFEAWDIKWWRDENKNFFFKDTRLQSIKHWLFCEFVVLIFIFCAAVSQRSRLVNLKSNRDGLLCSSWCSILGLVVFPEWLCQTHFVSVQKFFPIPVIEPKTWQHFDMMLLSCDP